MQTDWFQFEQQQRFRNKTVTLWSIYLIFILILSLKPFHFSLDYFRESFQFKQGFFQAFRGDFNLLDLILNVVLFIPFGFFTRLWLRQEKDVTFDLMKRSLLVCLAVSLTVEFAQLFLIRSASLFDILANLAGAFPGILWARSVSLDAQKKWPGQLIVNQWTPLVKVLAVAYTGLVVVVYSLPLALNGFSNWNGKARLYIGHEPPYHNPWKGTVFELAIYDQMLNQDEVLQCFYRHRPVYLNQNLLALYQFNQEPGEIIRDQSGQFPGLDLQIQDTSFVNWSHPRDGLNLIFGSRILSQEPAQRLVQQLKERHQFSLEVRFKTGHIIQPDRACIVALSDSVEKSNFRLSQVGNKLNFHVRTLLTGESESVIDLCTNDSVLTGNIQHVVAVFNRGTEQIYLNGQALNECERGFAAYFPFLTGFGKSRLGRICFYFVFLFPLGWLTHRTVYSDKKKLFVGIVWTASPICVLQILFFLFLEQPFDFLVFGVSVFTALLVLILSQFPFFAEWE